MNLLSRMLAVRVCVREKAKEINLNIDYTQKYTFDFVCFCFVSLHSLTFMVDPLSIYKSGAPIISVDGSVFYRRCLYAYNE